MPISELNKMRKHRFCEFYKKLYWGPSVKNRQLVKWKLSHGSGQLDIYCVTRASMEQDQLDIIHCAFLRQRYYLDNPVMVYGIAKGYNEAVDIVMQISREACIAGMDGKLLDFLNLEE